jgi:NADH-quinone oxidoreductase subunit N
VLAFEAPSVDFHAFAPELVVLAALCLLILVDVMTSEFNKWAMSTIAGIGLLGAMLPVITLAYDGVARVLFDGAYVVDNYALILKALFLLSGYVVVLLSTNYIAEGDYWEGEYYQLVLSSVLGMMIMASARDLVSIFVALELLSIPAYMLAAWRKRDLRSDEAGMKYYLMGVFASAVMLYGMSLLYGYTGTTQLAGISNFVAAGKATPIVILSIVFVLIGFAFKVSAVPFHTWAPDTYEGAPTPVTAFLAVSSKAAGFVALTTLVFVGFYGRSDVYGPFLWVLSALTMTIGNLIALRQNNVVRMLAYSGIAQAGYILAPLAVAGTAGNQSMQAVVTYLLIYAGMNLGAFAVVIAVARKTGSAELDSFNGLFTYAPGLTVSMSIFLFSLAGIPPLAGWFAKFVIFRSLVSTATWEGYVLAILVGLNSVVALFYYARVARAMWMEPAADGDTTPIQVPLALRAALAITVVVTVVFGILPSMVSHFTDTAVLVGLGP